MARRPESLPERLRFPACTPVMRCDDRICLVFFAEKGFPGGAGSSKHDEKHQKQQRNERKSTGQTWGVSLPRYVAGFYRRLDNNQHGISVPCKAYRDILKTFPGIIAA